MPVVGVVSRSPNVTVPDTSLPSWTSRIATSSVDAAAALAVVSHDATMRYLPVRGAVNVRDPAPADPNVVHPDIGDVPDRSAFGDSECHRPLPDTMFVM